MQIFTNLDSVCLDEPTVVVLGKFDGIHKGHQKLFHEAEELSRSRHLKKAVFTFQFLSENGNLLTTRTERYRIFEEMKIDYLVECPFEMVQDMKAERFIDEIVVSRMHAEVMVAGTDCRFGRERRGDARLACERMAHNGRQGIIISKVLYGTREISSSYVRQELSGGNIPLVNSLLGYHYFFEGVVVSGNHIGRTLDFPTLNLVPEKAKALPPYGVYASNVILEGRCCQGITNIGIKPTVGSPVPVVETYLIDFDEDAYGKNIRVELLEFVRPEKRFENLDALKAQIQEDIRYIQGE